MGVYYRKSLSLGPFRVNVSKSGVGWSFGGGGLRTGMTGRGRRYTTFNMNFEQFVKAATGHEQGPFDYQGRRAGGTEGCGCESKLINIPTGLGKTAGVVLA